MPAVTDFGEILLYLIVGIVFVLGGLFTARLIRPNRPNVEKLSTYESGEAPQGNAWGQFNVRFYIIALVFILFDVELVFLFPWATIFARQELIDATHGLWGWFAFTEMMIFVLILLLGLAWAWARGLLDWVKPDPQRTSFQSPVPASYYQTINKQIAAQAKPVKKESGN